MQSKKLPYYDGIIPDQNVDETSDSIKTRVTSDTDTYIEIELLTGVHFVWDIDSIPSVIISDESPIYNGPPLNNDLMDYYEAGDEIDSVLAGCFADADLEAPEFRFDKQNSRIGHLVFQASVFPRT